MKNKKIIAFIVGVDMVLALLYTLFVGGVKLDVSTLTFSTFSWVNLQVLLLAFFGSAILFLVPILISVGLATNSSSPERQSFTEKRPAYNDKTANLTRLANESESPAKYITCTNCGQENSDVILFCGKCGKSLAGEPSSEKQNDNPVIEAHQQSLEDKTVDELNTQSEIRKYYTATIIATISGALLGAALGAPNFPLTPDRVVPGLVIGVISGILGSALGTKTDKSMRLLDHNDYSFWVRSGAYGGAFTGAIYNVFFWGGMVNIAAAFIVGAIFGAIFGLVISFIGLLLGIRTTPIT